MFRRLTKAIYYGAAIIEHTDIASLLDYAKGFAVMFRAPKPVPPRPSENDPLIDIEDDELDNFGWDEPVNDPWIDKTLDEVLDCTPEVHRRYCRKFDREVKELYWLTPEEVTQSGSYLRFEGGFHVPQNVVIVPLEGKMVELFGGGQVDPQPLKKDSVYLGPLPRTPNFFDKELF